MPLLSKKNADALPVAGVPTVDLLPDAVIIEHQRVRLRLWGLVAIGLILVLALAGWGSASLATAAAEAQQENAKQHTAQVQAEIRHLQPVANLMANVQLLKSARMAATAQEADWLGFITNLQNVLPPDVAMTNLDIETAQASLGAGGTASVIPAPNSIGTAAVTLNSRTVPDTSIWLADIRPLKGVQGVAVQSINNQTAGNKGGNSQYPYQVTLTITLNADLYQYRFGGAK
jgi:hypothetical protein